MRAASLQFVRKISGSTKPSAANADAFDLAVDRTTTVVRELLASLVTSAPARNREEVAKKARAKARPPVSPPQAGNRRLKNLAAIAATAIVLLILLATSVPLMHWFTSEGRRASLDEAENLWRSHVIRDYDMTVMKTCDCPAPAGQAVSVSIRDSGLEGLLIDGQQTADAESLLRGQGIPLDVDELFATVRAAMVDDPDVLEIEYDNDYGFPRRIRIDRRKAYDNDDLSYTVSSFRPR